MAQVDNDVLAALDEVTSGRSDLVAVAASRDFYELESNDELEEATAAMREQLSNFQKRLEARLGAPSAVVERPDWFEEAMTAVCWKQADGEIFLALHHDDQELPVMISLGKR